jgi:hypothetical protein
MVNMVYFFEMDSDIENGSIGIRFPYNWTHFKVLAHLTANLCRKLEDMNCFDCNSELNLWICENCQAILFCSQCLVTLVKEKRVECPSCQGKSFKMVKDSYPSIPEYRKFLVKIQCRNCQKITSQESTTDSAKERLCPTCFLEWYFRSALD